MSQTGRSGKAVDPPEYWFVQRVEEIVQQREGLASHRLSPQRSTCSIAAGGKALHNKKPGYFQAETLPPYDRSWQHRREAAGRPVDPEGGEYVCWQTDIAEALCQRRAQLRSQADELRCS